MTQCAGLIFKIANYLCGRTIEIVQENCRMNFTLIFTVLRESLRTLAKFNKNIAKLLVL